MSLPGLKKAAVSCILRCGDKYLLLKRNKEPNKGLFVPVGGKIDPYESPSQAVVRETLEETGIAISDPRFCGILTETSPIAYNWIVYVYLIDIEYVSAPYCDEGELHWVSFSELNELGIPPTDEYIYRYVSDGKSFVFNAILDESLALISITEDIEGVELVSGK